RNQARPFDYVDRIPIYAEEVNIGDCMLVVDETSKQFIERHVEDVTLTWERGIYAPMTSNSDIIVNGVLSSCYNNVMSNVLQTT
ncbi:CRE-GRD-1 protein, partial [Aphelenchoides avenae]